MVHFSFSDILTNTSANLASSTGTAAYNTLFGTATRSEILTQNTTDFSDLDDVLQFENVSFTGDLISARVDLDFVDTTGTGVNEQFFSFSGDYEQFAIITEDQAKRN